MKRLTITLQEDGDIKVDTENIFFFDLYAIAEYLKREAVFAHIAVNKATKKPIEKPDE